MKIQFRNSRKIPNSITVNCISLDPPPTVHQRYTIKHYIGTINPGTVSPGTINPGRVLVNQYKSLAQRQRDTIKTQNDSSSMILLIFIKIRKSRNENHWSGCRFEMQDFEIMSISKLRNFQISTFEKNAQSARRKTPG